MLAIVAASLPAYCRYCEKDEYWYCTWCDATMYGQYTIDTHLNGNIHANKCRNAWIVPFGDKDHLAEAEEYVRNYGSDIWALNKDWPQFLIISKSRYYCEACKFFMDSNNLIGR